MREHYQVTDEWLAGFFDGEGCITVLRSRGSPPIPQVDLTQKDEAVLRAVRERFGGLLREHRGGTWHLKWYGQNVVGLLEALLPHLLLKRQRAEWALEMARTVRGQGNRLTVREWASRMELADRIQEVNRGARKPN
jgi:hypothetical protein